MRSKRIRHIIGILVCCVSVCTASAQESPEPYVWTELTDAPYVGRYNDVHFVNENAGWVVNGDGEVYGSLDGGLTWTKQYQNLNAHFRSVAFLDELHGFAGNVGFGEFGAVEITPIFETVDGGEIWLPASGYVGDPPVGICGMQAVNETTLVAVGRVRGPAVFTRTTDSGATWESTDMSPYAAGLIDVYFTHPDSGLAVGLSNELHSLSSAVILRTTDGGKTWEKVFTSTRTGEWAWKMSFPSRSTGYVSLQRNTESPIYFLKTSDGGDTWEEKLLFDGRYYAQGLGFVDENIGWVGGNSTSPVLTTSDGGDTWQEDELRPRLNRVRFLNDSLGFAVGRAVYKIERPTIISVDRPRVENPILAYPNPFSETITFELVAGPRSTDLRIIDVTGREVRNLADNFTGERITWDGIDNSGIRVSSGVYFLIVDNGIRQLSQSIIHIDSSSR